MRQGWCTVVRCDVLSWASRAVRGSLRRRCSGNEATSADHQLAVQVPAAWFSARKPGLGPAGAAFQVGEAPHRPVWLTNNPLKPRDKTVFFFCTYAPHLRRMLHAVLDKSSEECQPIVPVYALAHRGLRAIATSRKLIAGRSSGVGHRLRATWRRPFWCEELSANRRRRSVDAGRRSGMADQLSVSSHARLL